MVTQRNIDVDALDDMGAMMRNRWTVTKQSMSGQQDLYASIAPDSFAVISRPEGDKVVFVSHSNVHIGKPAVPFCHEVMDSRFAQYSYPLMKSQLKEDLGQLKEFLSKDRRRLSFYSELTKGGVTASVLDDLTCVRAILQAERRGLPPTPQGAKQALQEVVSREIPTFAFKLNAQEKQVLIQRTKSALG